MTWSCGYHCEDALTHWTWMKEAQTLFFFTDYLYNFASAATKKITESVTETAQTIKKSVEEGKIDDILDKVHFDNL